MLPRIVTEVPRLPVRGNEGHKGTYGRALVVAGSRGMSGAACLAGVAALRGGAGLVTVAVPASVAAIVAGCEPSYMTVALPEDESGKLGAEAMAPLMTLCGKATAVACGPGWGLSDGTQHVIAHLYAQVAVPMVIDADGLNALAQLETWPAAAAERLITPHPGEFARLCRTDTATVQRRREELAVEFAKSHGVVVLLKGHRTVITDGERMAINTTGNPGMSTGGTGDVLTGLIVALLAQGLSAFDAAQLGAHIHGLAGDLAAEHLSQLGLIASDLLRYLGPAWRAY